MNDNRYITVTQLTKYIKYKIDTDEHLSNVFLKGEISNFKAHSRGHYYFTLKDETSKINAVMFSSNANKLKFIPVDGMKILITGKVSIYEATGGYQIYVNDIIEDGIGSLFIAFEQLKEKLSKEGLFDNKYKKKLPKYPTKIGIVTAPTGAAIKDILSTVRRRCPMVSTYIFPSLVQGNEAALNIVKQIELANTYDLDLLIVGRGGGSIEDMWCFNEEIVARAIFNSKIPIISAVGHEVDFTISDFVADLRAPTPTGAAEMAVKNNTDILEYLNQINKRLTENINFKLDTYFKKLNSILDKYVLKEPMAIFEVKSQKYDYLLEKIKYNFKRIYDTNNQKYINIKNNYILNNPKKLYEKKKNSYTELFNKLNLNCTIYIEKTSNKFDILISKLETLNPLLTMKRGYSITKINDKCISSINKINTNDTINTILKDGVIISKVIEIEINK